MKIITSIEISNFRSIVKADLSDLSDLNIIVGKNDIGKSNFLKALNLFFNGETEIGTKFNFKEDFSRYAKIGQKKAKEIVIKITFITPYKENSIKWTKIWREHGLYKEILANQNGKNPNARSGAYQLVKKLQYNYIPAIKGNEYFTYLMGMLHDTLSEVNNKQFSEASTGLITGLSSLMDNLTTEIDTLYDEDNCKNELSVPSNLKNLFSTLSFTLDRGGEKIPLEKRGDGIKARHIPVILQFIATHQKSITGKRVSPIETIWGFEEPENNMELTTAFKAAEQFYKYSKSIQIFMNTHSPAFYQLSKKDNSVNLIFAKNEGDKPNTILEKYSTNKLDILDSQMGLLPVIADHIEEAVNESNLAKTKLKELEKEIETITTSLIITEGKTDWKHFKKALTHFQNNGEYNDIDVSFLEYENEIQMSDSHLKLFLDNASKIKQNKRIIGIFDCDEANGKKYAQKEFNDLGNNVYAFSIPKPTYRLSHSGISVELLYQDSDLHKQDCNGRRLYLTSEFNERGRLKGDSSISVENSNNVKKYLDPNNNKILDSEVTDGINNIALTKNDFSNNILAGTPPFDSVSFEGFREIFNILIKISNCPLK